MRKIQLFSKTRSSAGTPARASFNSHIIMSRPFYELSTVVGHCQSLVPEHCSSAMDVDAGASSQSLP